MSWIATGTPHGTKSLQPLDGPAGQTLIVQGSLVLETRPDLTFGKGVVLAEIDDQSGWDRHLSMVLHPDDSLHLHARQGPAKLDLSLDLPPTDKDAPHRITWSWNAPRRVGLLTVHNLRTGAMRQLACSQPHAIPVRDLAHFVQAASASGTCQMAAAASQIVPVGPAPGIAEGTPIRTTQGYRDIDRLQPGDEVITRSGRIFPIRWIITGLLPSGGDFTPVTLRAPYHGLAQDITLTRSTRLLFSASEATYLFGHEGVFLRAGHLADGRAGLDESGLPPRRFYQLLLDEHDCLDAAGMWVESLFIGNLRDMPRLHQTSHLAPLTASALPRHTPFAAPTLARIESVTLLTAMAG